MKSTSRQRKKLISEIRQMSRELQFPAMETEEASIENLKQRRRMLKNLMIMEAEPTSTLAKELIKVGVELPAPDQPDDEEVKEKLAEVLGILFRHGHIFEHGEHLKERELYDKLWTDIFNQPANEFEDDLDEDDGGPGCYTHWDLLDDGSPESLRILKEYYGYDYLDS